MPAPITRAVEPGSGLARFTAWIATDSGSRRAAASNETLSGNLYSGQSVTGAVGNTELSLLVAPDSGMINPLLQRALVVRVGFGTASETQLFAQVITTFTADAAVSTSNTNFKSNSVAQLEAAHLRTNSNNFPGRFMA